VDQPRKLYCLFCGEDKGHTTRTCQVTIQKQKEIAEAEARQNQPKQVLHTASCYSPYIPEYVGNQPAASVASSSHSQASWPQLPLPPPLPPTHTEASRQKGTSTLNSSTTLGRSLKLVQSIALYQNRSIYIEEYPTFDVLLSFMTFYFLCEKLVMKNLISISCNNCACTRVKYIFLMD
jgi:hypothetical protein